MRRRSPSRITSARGLVRSRSASSTRSVRVSCTTVIDDRQAGEHQQDERFLEVAEHQVDRAAGEQQREHRLAQHFQHDPQRRAAVGLRQFVEALGGLAGADFRLVEAADRHRQRKRISNISVLATDFPATQARRARHHSAPGVAGDQVTPLIAIRFDFGVAGSVFGSVTVRTPFLNAAVTLSSAIAASIGTRRSKRP